MTYKAPSSRPLSVVDQVLWLLATGLGTGLMPKGPGTFGSLLGPPLVWALLGTQAAKPLLLLCGVICFVVGIPICNAGIRIANAKDPKQVVFDEIAAFFWVFLFVPINLATVIGGFLLFRVFDILKPWPVHRLERLPRGLGVMADDAAAGLIAGGVLGAGWWWMA